MNTEDRFAASWPHVAGTTSAQREAARALMERCAEQGARWDRVANRLLGVSLAVLVGVAVAWALIIWATECSLGAALCAAPVVLPTRRRPWQGLLTAWWHQLRASYFDALAAHAEEDVEHYEAQLIYLPLQIRSHAAAISRYRAEAIRCRGVARDVRGQ